jgi:hypothetical protein
MSVEAPVSQHKRNTDLIIVAVLIAAALWLLYDGWMNEKFVEEHSQTDVRINRYYGPIAAILGAVYFGVSAMRDRGRKLVANERGLTLENGQLIEYSAMRRIDKRFFDSEGHFTIDYAGEAGEHKVKLRDRRYDNLALLLDEVVKQTGAAPVEKSAQDAKESSQSC